MQTCNFKMSKIISKMPKLISKGQKSFPRNFARVDLGGFHVSGSCRYLPRLFFFDALPPMKVSPIAQKLSFSQNIFEFWKKFLSFGAKILSFMDEMSQMTIFKQINLIFHILKQKSGVLSNSNRKWPFNLSFRF